MLPPRDPKKIPLDLRRKLYLAMSDNIAKQLDALGVTEEEIDRDFNEYKKRRRRE